MAYVDDLLGDGEEKLFEAHPHWTMLARHIATRVLLVLVLLVVGIVLKAKVSNASVGAVLLGIFFIAAAVFFVQAAIQYLRWKNEHYIITDHRVIQVYGLLGKHSIDSSLNMINDIVLNQTVFGRMLNYGDLTIVTGNDVGADALQHVADPLAFKRAVLAAREAYAERLSGYRAPPHATMPLATQQEDVTSLIARLADLRDRGAISQAEFDTKRTELLRRI